MLMNEIASAADTLELYKLINDSVWSALQKLQREENERKAAARRAAAANRSSRKSKRTASAFSPVEVPPFPTPAIANSTAALAASNQPASAVSSASNAKAKSDAAYAVVDADDGQGDETANALDTSNAVEQKRPTKFASKNAKNVG
ncbi:MAG: hypothetical protein RLZZ591_285 [Pseudomonadota bacterium]